MKKVNECIGLLSSMISSGESHSETSRRVIAEAKAEIEALKKENEILVKVRNVAMELYAKRAEISEKEDFDIYRELTKIGRADIPYCELKMEK